MTNCCIPANLPISRTAPYLSVKLCAYFSWSIGIKSCSPCVSGREYFQRFSKSLWSQSKISAWPVHWFPSILVYGCIIVSFYFISPLCRPFFSHDSLIYISLFSDMWETQKKHRKTQKNTEKHRKTQKNTPRACSARNTRVASFLLVLCVFVLYTTNQAASRPSLDVVPTTSVTNV